jgi:hypothetical protein
MHELLLNLWPTEAEVRACIKQEAEAIDEAVLLAVHQPMRFQRRDVGAGGATITRSEDDLLDEFLTPNLPEGRLILPIVGSSGVGKSHVIRWIHAQLGRLPNASRFHIIRVPKGASLKRVLRELLHNLEGPAFDRLREALATARDHLDPERAARELQLSLRLRLERAAEDAKQRMADGRELAGDRELRAFGDARMLPALLGDPLLEQQHWLARPDNRPGVLALMAEQVTQEGRQNGDGRRHEFVAEDLILSDSIDFSELSKQARDCYGSINRGESTRREQAARVLNQVLDEAKNDLLQLGDNSLVELFEDVRAELHRQGRELVFLVEDFAVLSGLQGALLQVMIAEATRDGTERLCTMRSALAYTEGYMAGRDTVLTRARSEWLLEDRPGSDAEILRKIERLVGAYLNAARVGQTRLRRAYAEGGETGLRVWIPTIDVKNLEPGQRAFIDEFGRSEDGYPLFPFNAAAVRQLARRGSVDSRDQLLFNPRYVINNILTRVLQERSSFVRSAFPPQHLADELRSAEVTTEVGRRVPRDMLKQYLGVLRLWGDQPETTAEAAALPALIYEAFSLEPLDFGVKPAPPPGTTPTSPTDAVPPVGSRGAVHTEAAPSEPPRTHAEHPEERRWRAVLEAWGAGTVLEQGDARELRGWISEAVYAFLPTDALLLRPRNKARDLLKQVYLPRSRGQGNLNPEAAFAVVARDAEFDDPLRRAELVRTLLAFVRRYAVHQNWDYDGAEVDGGLVRNFIEERAPAAIEYLRARHFQVDAHTLGPLVRGLLVGSRALGVPGARDRAGLGELFVALLDDAPKPPDGAFGPWAELQESLRATRPQWRELLLEQVGARQGGASSVHAIDAAALVPLVEAAKSDWVLGSAPPASDNDADYKEFVRQFNNIRTGIEKAVTEERQLLLDWLPSAITWFGEDFDKTAVQGALKTLVAEVKKRGLVPGANYESLRKEMSNLPSIALVTARDAAVRLREKPQRGEVLSVLADLPGRALAPATHFVELMDAFVTQAEHALAGRESAIGGDVVQAAVEAVGSQLESIDDLLSKCEERRT